MKILESFEEHGSRFGKRTNWIHYGGYWIVKFTDKTSISVNIIDKKEGESLLDLLDKRGYCTKQYRAKMVEMERVLGYPEKPEADNDLYYHNYGYEKPIELGGWNWSTTFGRWGRLVKFADGWHGYTYPKIKPSSFIFPEDDVEAVKLNNELIAQKSKAE